MLKIWLLSIVVMLALPLFTWAQTNEEETKDSPWIGKYPMSIFTRTRTAKTVGKGHLSVALKFQYFDYDKACDSDGCYHNLGDDNKAKFSNVFCAKFGWAKDHHLALGIPYIWNNSEINNKTLNNNGLSNIFVFEKWNIIRESEYIPGVSLDVWHYFPTGDSTRKIGTDDYAWKFSTEISKAWESFSVHINPSYRAVEGRDSDVIQGDAAVIFPTWKKLWPALEYNYTYTEAKGRCNELIPGFIWKFYPGASFKLGAVVNLDTTQKYKDKVGLVAKLFYRF